jgi:hypothetical protein
MTTHDPFDFEIKKMAIALRYTGKGFLCFSTIDSLGQAAVISALRGSLPSDGIEFIDAREINEALSKSYILNATSNACVKAHVICNFQLFAKNEDHIQFLRGLNMLRDFWSNKNHLFMLGMTKSFYYELVKNAPDFNSFFLACFHFDSSALDSELPVAMGAPIEGIPNSVPGIICMNACYKPFEYPLLQKGAIASELTLESFLRAWIACPEMSIGKDSKLIAAIKAFKDASSDWTRL